MASELRRSFKQKAKEAFGLPFRFRMGLEKLDADVSGSQGTVPEEFSPRSASFDLGYFTPSNYGGQTNRRAADEPQQAPLGEDFVIIEDHEKKDKKKPQIIVPPVGTLQYTVSSTDTLASIAAQFETTTSELKSVNRLMTDMVFPGKVIYVPDKNYQYVATQTMSVNSSPSSSPREAGGEQEQQEGQVLEETVNVDSTLNTGSGTIRMPDPDLLLMGMKPILSVACQTTSASAAGTTADGVKQQPDDDAQEQFIRLNVNQISDDKDDMVSGVLLITPNAVMFESNANDEHVIKNGRDNYDVIVPMAVIVSVTICHELNPMKPYLKETSSFEDEVFYSKTDTADADVRNAASEILSHTAAAGVTVKNCNSQVQDSAQHKLKSPDNPINSSDRSHVSFTFHGGDGSSNRDADNSAEVPGKAGIIHKEQLSSGSIFPLPDMSCGVEEVRSGETASKSLQIGPKSQKTCIPLRETVNNVTSVLSDIDSSALEDNKSGKEGSRVSQQNKNSEADIDNGSGKVDKHGKTEDKVERDGGEDKAKSKEKDYEDVRADKGDKGNPTDNLIVGDLKQTKPSGKESHSESSFSFDSPGKRCTSLVGNLFRFHSGSSLQELSTTQSTEKESEKESEVEAAKEVEGESLTPTHRLVTRTLESLTSYSRPLVDLSSSLFSRSGSDSKSPKKEDEKSESSLSPKFDNFKEKDPSVEPAPTQRIFFLRPFDLLRKKSRESSTELPEGANVLGPEQTSVICVEAPTTLYMCLRISQFVDWSSLKYYPVSACVRTRLKPEYWFTIPSDRVDQLYAFFLQWSPNIMDAADEINLIEKGFVVINSTDGSAGFTGTDDELSKLNFLGTSSMANKEWEIINAKEVRRMINVAEIESLPLPDLSETSRILTSAHVQELCFHLPPRAEGCPWQLVYSSDKHGFSLKTMYRQMSRVDSPVLLVIKDDSNMVFGAMLPCALKISDCFYGSGESYLFSFYPAFKKFSWTGHNNYFIKGNAESLSIGAGEGVYGLWLDSDLYHGRAQPCLTYDNDLLTVAEDFMIRCLEVWKFV